MVPTEELLTIEDVAADRRRRLTAAVAASGLALCAMAALWFRPALWVMLTAAAAIGAGLVLISNRYELPGRAHALLRVRRIREDGRSAVEKLTGGDIAGAREAFVALLPQAQSLQAFHATHVLMYGVTRFLEGDTAEGLRLAERALKSGWFEFPKMRALGEAATTWNVMMLITAKRLDAARALLDERQAFPTAHVVLAAAEGRFSDAISKATAALALAGLPASTRPTIAVVGLFAARQLNDSQAIANLEAVLAATPPGPLALKNPALEPFLPAAFR